MRWLIAIAGIAAFVGVAFGLDVLLMQIDRNNQGEYIDTATGALDYHYALLIFIPWFLISAIVTASVLFLVLVYLSWWERTLSFMLPRHQSSNGTVRSLSVPSVGGLQSLYDLYDDILHSPSGSVYLAILKPAFLLSHPSCLVVPGMS